MLCFNSNRYLVNIFLYITLIINIGNQKITMFQLELQNTLTASLQVPGYDIKQFNGEV